MRFLFITVCTASVLLLGACAPEAKPVDTSQQVNAGVNIIPPAILASERQLPDTTQPADDIRPDLVQVISQSQQGHDKILRALRMADMIPELQKAGPFTLLLPTDAAFDKLPPGSFDRLLAPANRSQLRTFLLYHQVSGRIAQKEMLQTNGQILTLSGKRVIINAIDNKVMVNDTNVIRAENAASNGVIYWLDSVLLPPT